MYVQMSKKRWKYKITSDFSSILHFLLFVKMSTKLKMGIYENSSVFLADFSKLF